MASHLDELAHQMAGVLASFGLSTSLLGRPQLVEKAAQESARLFQGSASARPSKEDSYAAALAFMRGQILSERQVDLVASALSERIAETGGGRPVGHPKLVGLLEEYEGQAQAGDLWRLTWFGLLGSYFAFDAAKASAVELTGWGQLRDLLQRTWPLIDRQTGSAVVPDWVKVLRGDAALLSNRAAHRYALDYLRGDEEPVKRLSTDLGVPQSSWFWHALVLSAVRRSAEQSDDQFKAAIPKLLSLVERRPVFRDEALEVILTRYHRCKEAPLHPRLRDYAVRKDVWRNPKLRAAGLATSWNQVADPVWMMVLQWVNAGNLRDFFGILATRHNADEGRLAFWSRYMEQISSSWTRLIFSSETTQLATRNADIRELIAREDGSYATLWGNRNLDAFMMQIGEYVIVEFSMKGNAAYVYEAGSLKFDRHAARYHGGTQDLRYGFHDSSASVRIVHTPGWELDAEYKLAELGIHPDGSKLAKKRPAAPVARAPAPPPPVAPVQTVAPPANTAAANPRSPLPSASLGTDVRSAPGQAPTGASFTMKSLAEVVAKYPGVYIDDKRAGPLGGSGPNGRLWVEGTSSGGGLALTLKSWGFRWSEKRSAYYFPEN